MPQPYTRVTLRGPRRHVDLLLPSTAAVGTLMPQILDLLGDEPGERVATKVLLTAVGEPIPARLSLADAGVYDGAQLTLVSNRDAPPPAVVYDIADTVVERSAEVRGQWGHRHLVIASGIFAAAGLLLALDILFGRYLPGQRWWASAASGGILLALGASIATASKPVATTLLGAGWGLAMLGWWHWDAGTTPRLLLAAVVTTVLVACLATVVPRPRAALMGAGIMGALTGIWALAVPFSTWASATAVVDRLAGTGGTAAICSVLVLGLLPGLALGASGLARLDDRRATGSSIWRRDALAAIGAAHTGLTLATIAAAGSAAAGMWLLGRGAGRPEWTLPLLLALALATMLRARSFPMAIERYALYGATAVGVLSGVLALAALEADTVWIVGVGVLVLAVLTGLGLAVDLPEHTEARLRQIAERLESVAIIATVPLLAGYFGVFAQMLDTF